MVAGNDFYIHPFLSEELQRLPRVPADPVLQDHIKQRDDFCRKAVLLLPALPTIAQGHDPSPFLQLPFQIRRKLSEQLFRRARKHRADSGEADTAPFSYRRKGSTVLRPVGLVFRKCFPQRQESGIVVAAGSHIRARKLLRLTCRKDVRRDNGADLQLSVRQRPCLVQAERIHMGQRFQGKNILHQDLHPGKPDHSGRKGNGDQKHQAFGQHSQKSRRRGHHRLVHRRMPPQQRLQEQKGPQGNDAYAGKIRHSAHGAKELRLHPLFLPHFRNKLRGVVFFSHMGNSGVSLSDHHKASGIQLSSFPFRHRIAFPGQKGFVDLDRTIHHNRVIADLASAFQNNQIALYHLFLSGLPFPAFPDQADCRTV